MVVYFFSARRFMALKRFSIDTYKRKVHLNGVFAYSSKMEKRTMSQSSITT